MSITAKKLTGYNRCNKRRKYPKTQPVSELSKAASVAVYARDAAADIATGNTGVIVPAADFMNSLTDGNLTATDEAMRDELIMALERYKGFEKRAGMKVQGKDVIIFDENVYTAPDVIFTGIRGETKRPYVEAVSFKYRRPDVTERGRKPDAGIKTTLEMYCLLQYAKSLAKPADGEEIDIGASFYFLKAADYDSDFFAKEKGVKPSAVTLWDTVIGGVTGPTSVDTTYASVWEAFKRGEDYDGEAEECKYCPFAASCRFTKPQEALKDDNAGIKSVSKLTPSQEEAVAFDSGIARINAGAGSGKTTVIAKRVARLIKAGASPESILLLTFTNAAAEEFRKRIASYVGHDPEGLMATTFHSFGDGIVRANYKELGFTAPPRLIDDVERTARIADIIEETFVQGLDYGHFDCELPTCKGALPVAVKVFDIFKRKGITGDEISGTECTAVLKALGRDARFITAPAENTCANPAMGTIFDLYDLYSKEYVPGLKNANLIEYDDQISGALIIADKDPDMIPKFDHVIVDEFQDTSPDQMELLRDLVKNAKSLVVVGDDSQAIYGFRGTSPEFIINFEDEIGEKVEDMYLLENHRSTPEIVAFANKVNAKNKNRVKKDLVATRPSGTPINVLEVEKAGELIPTVSTMIKNLHDAGHKYSDIAYIAYTRAELLRVKEDLDALGIPAVLMCPEPALENPRIAAALSFAALIKDPSITQNAVDFLSVAWDGKLGSEENLADGIRRVCAGAEHIKDTGDVGEFMEFMSELKPDADEVFKAFLDALTDKGTLDAIIAYCADFNRYGTKAAYKKEGRYDGVILVTAHSAKGLEYPVVINDISRYDNQDLSPDEVEERRRLLFVSATRAKDELIILGKTYISGNAYSDDAVFNRFLEEAQELA